MYVYIDNVRMTLTGCTFSENTATYDGGGLYVNTDNYDVSLDSCVFTENSAERNGGGVYLSTSNLGMELMNATFSGNVAVSGSGGALAAAFYNSDMVVRESMFFNNDAGLAGKLGAVNLHNICNVIRISTIYCYL